MKVKFKFKIVKTGEIYNDDCEVESLETAKEEIEALLKKFNKEEEDKYKNTDGLRVLESIGGLIWTS